MILYVPFIRARALEPEIKFKNIPVPNVSLAWKGDKQFSVKVAAWASPMIPVIGIDKEGFDEYPSGPFWTVP